MPETDGQILEITDRNLNQDDDFAMSHRHLTGQIIIRIDRRRGMPILLLRENTGRSTKMTEGWSLALHGANRHRRDDLGMRARVEIERLNDYLSEFLALASRPEQSLP
jgi:hypothetical protein